MVCNPLRMSEFILFDHTGFVSGITDVLHCLVISEKMGAKGR
jgi:hypothetical protein